ncbi:MAG TPA: hypothetical protein VM582_03645, partial [Candidatus Thermoplasmatota archaeon]|nr:hypothetical protein [Candidatus Thermoplasmatota archaeon]
PMLDCPESPTTTDAPGERAGYPEIRFSVSENATGDGCLAFVGPATATAGWTAVTLHNDGMAPHIMPMYFLGEHTLDDFVQAMSSGEEPDWAVPVGGVGVATPFQTATVIMELQEGNYAIVCFFEGHHLRGMYRQLTVEHPDEHDEVGEHPELPAPTANYTIELNDFAFVVPNMTAGTHVIRVVNNGEQPHEAPLIRLNENTSMQQFLAAIENPQGPPPGAGVGGVNVLAPGAEAYFVVDLVAGDYGLVCFVTSPEHGAPHIALGMVAQFSVAAAGDAGAEGDDADATNTTA